MMVKANNTIKINENNLADIKEILIIGSIGIGNLLLFSPALEAVRKKFKNARISIIVLKRGFKYLYESDPSVDKVIVLDSDSKMSISQKIKFIRELRKNNFDLCITTFPANRLEYNMLAFLSGAKYRITHDYELNRSKTFPLLQNVRVKVDKNIHDLEQNLNLIAPLGISPEDLEKKVSLAVSDENRKEAEEYLEKAELTGKKLVGIHAGSSAERGMDLKQWSETKFADLIDRLYENYDIEVLLFGGPEERTQRQKIVEFSKSSPIIVTDVSLLTTAAIISQCSFFVSNDSGLMHVSTAMGVRTAGLFGLSDPLRTAPYGEWNSVIRLDLDCSPCWSINNLGVGNVNCVHSENICMTNMTVDYVFDKIQNEIRL